MELAEINYKKTDGIEIKNMVLPIFKDDSLYKDVSIFLGINMCKCVCMLEQYGQHTVWQIGSY
jgi:hypothetical protein